MPARFNPVKIFSGTKSAYLAERISQSFGQELGDLSTVWFSDGEFQPSFNETVRGCDLFLIQSTFAPADNLMELLFMIDAAKRASAHYITAVIPYFGFARQDRKDKPRVAIGAKLVANVLASAGIHRIMTMDLHAAQIQGFFEVPVDHLDSSVIFIPYIKSLELEHLVVAAPDMGGSARAKFFAQSLGSEMAICYKHRNKPNEIASMKFIGDVKGKNVVIVDDIVDTGGTLSKAADLMLAEGALTVRAFCTHPVLSGKAYETINNSRLSELIVCDTIPLKEQSDKIKVLTVAHLFAEAIRNVYEHGSISSLFKMADTHQTSLVL